MAPHLGEYIHLLTPAIVNIFEASENPADCRLLAMQALANLCQDLNFRYTNEETFPNFCSEYATRVVHPLSRLLQQPDSVASVELKNMSLKILCFLIYHLGSDFAVFVPVIVRIFSVQSPFIFQKLMDLTITRIVSFPANNLIDLSMTLW